MPKPCPGPIKAESLWVSLGMSVLKLPGDSRGKGGQRAECAGRHKPQIILSHLLALNVGKLLNSFEPVSSFILKIRHIWLNTWAPGQDHAWLINNRYFLLLLSSCKGCEVRASRSPSAKWWVQGRSLRSFTSVFTILQRWSNGQSRKKNSCSFTEWHPWARHGAGALETRWRKRSLSLPS